MAKKDNAATTTGMGINEKTGKPLSQSKNKKKAKGKKRRGSGY